MIEYTVYEDSYFQNISDFINSKILQSGNIGLFYSY